MKIIPHFLESIPGSALYKILISSLTITLKALIRCKEGKNVKRMTAEDMVKIRFST